MQRQLLAQRQPQMARNIVAEAKHDGLDPALDPSPALRQPLPECDGSFLVGTRVDGGALIAEPREPDAEIGILRHVERIPAAHLFQHRAREVRY